MKLPHAEWITGSLAAGGTLLAMEAGSDEWTAKAYTAIGVCAVFIGGGIMLLGRIDKAWMERRKSWEVFNKDSITSQLAFSNESLVKMRESLHELRNTENLKVLENQSLHADLSTLRQQFMDVAKDLHCAESDLREANVTIQTTLGTVRDIHVRLLDCEAGRKVLSKDLDQIRSVAKSNADRIDTLEGSGEHRPVPDQPSGSP